MDGLSMSPAKQRTRATNVTPLSRVIGFFGRLAGFVDRHRVTSFVLVAVWLSFEFWVFGSNSYVRLFDNGDAVLPARIGLNLWRSGHALGLWASHWVAGVDRLAQGDRTGDLGALPFLFLPGWLAYGLVMFAQRFIAGLFAYKLAREDLETGPVMAMLVGITYAAFIQPTGTYSPSGFSLYDAFALPALPLVLWLLHRTKAVKGVSEYLVTALLGLGLAVSSSYQLGVFVVLAAWWWLLFVVRRADGTRANTLGRLALFSVGWTIGALPVVLVDMVLAPVSQHTQYVNGSFAVLSGSLNTAVGALTDNYLLLVTAVALLAAVSLADGRLRRAVLYGGSAAIVAVPLCRWLAGLLGLNVATGVDWAVAIALLAGLVTAAIRNRGRARTLSISLLVAITFIGAFPLVDGVLARVSRTLASFEWARVFLLVPLVALALAAEAFTRATRDPEKLSATTRRATAILACVGVVVIAATTITVKGFEFTQWSSRHNSYAYFYEKPVLEKLAADTVGKPPFRVVSPSYGGVDNVPGFMWAYGFDTADGYANIYNLSYNSYWTQVCAPAFAADPTLEEYFHSGVGRVTLWPSANAASDANGAPSPSRGANQIFDLDLLSLANVRYIITPTPVVDSRLRLVDHDARFGIYENTEALPRFFLADGTRTFPTDAALFSALGHAKLSELARTVYLNQKHAPGGASPSSAGSAPGTVRTSVYSADRMKVSVSCARDCWLVVSQTWSPFWTAKVDGATVPIEPAYGAFQCVRLGAGVHDVSLDYGYANLQHDTAAR